MREGSRRTQDRKFIVELKDRAMNRILRGRERERGSRPPSPTGYMLTTLGLLLLNPHTYIL